MNGSHELERNIFLLSMDEISYNAPYVQFDSGILEFNGALSVFLSAVFIHCILRILNFIMVMSSISLYISYQFCLTYCKSLLLDL